MKIWNEYGSEHSMNLVLIGRFKRAQDADRIERDIKILSGQAQKDDNHSIAFAAPEDQRFSDEMLALLRTLNLNTLAPADLGQLLHETDLSRDGDQITVRTDEIDVSVFVKLFIEAGAKVEVFSAHDYPSESDEPR